MYSGAEFLIWILIVFVLVLGVGGFVYLLTRP